MLSAKNKDGRESDKVPLAAASLEWAIVVSEPSKWIYNPCQQRPQRQIGWSKKVLKSVPHFRRPCISDCFLMQWPKSPDFTGILPDFFSTNPGSGPGSVCYLGGNSQCGTFSRGISQNCPGALKVKASIDIIWAMFLLVRLLNHRKQILRSHCCLPVQNIVQNTQTLLPFAKALPFIRIRHSVLNRKGGLW